MTGVQDKPLILIVDDTPANIKILMEALKGDFDLGVATNGAEAIEYVEKKLPDLILMDIIMPDMDGYEVCSRLKGMGHTKDAPIIFISSLQEIEDKAKGFELGAVDYITKPFEVVEVLARVRTHVELKQAREDLKDKNQKLDELSTKLSKYLSPQIYDSIFSGERDVKLETHRKTLTVFLSDIVGFTELTDSMESEALTYLLNDYLNAMSEIALRNGGTLDKFIGDAILIFFGDPETKGEREDAVACLRMALEMRERMKPLRTRWDKQGVPKPLHIRMGITSGYCTVGNFGSENRLEYTIVGGQVNLASRLQQYADPDQILISHYTYPLIKDEFVCEKKEKIRVKGIGYPVEIFQLIGFKEELLKRQSELQREIEEVLTSPDTIKLNEADRKSVV